MKSRGLLKHSAFLETPEIYLDNAQWFAYYLLMKSIIIAASHEDTVALDGFAQRYSRILPAHLRVVVLAFIHSAPMRSAVVNWQATRKTALSDRGTARKTILKFADEDAKLLRSFAQLAHRPSKKHVELILAAYLDAEPVRQAVVAYERTLTVGAAQPPAPAQSRPASAPIVARHDTGSQSDTGIHRDQRGRGKLAIPGSARPEEFTAEQRAKQRRHTVAIDAAKAAERAVFAAGRLEGESEKDFQMRAQRAGWQANAEATAAYVDDEFDL